MAQGLYKESPLKQNGAPRRLSTVRARVSLSGVRIPKPTVKQGTALI